MRDITPFLEGLTHEQIVRHCFGPEEWREIFQRVASKGKPIWLRAYGVYLGSDAWMRKRDQRLKMDNHKCVTPMCFTTGPFDVHHKSYSNVGDEDVENDLVTLCRNCHLLAHGRDGELLIPTEAS